MGLFKCFLDLEWASTVLACGRGRVSQMEQAEIRA
ncbi:jg3150, partial [Pararge aegeria aegeria]